MEKTDNKREPGYEEAILKLLIVDTMQAYVNENERESIPRRGFLDVAERLTKELMKPENRIKEPEI